MKDLGEGLAKVVGHKFWLMLSTATTREQAVLIFRKKFGGDPKYIGDVGKDVWAGPVPARFIGHGAKGIKNRKGK